MENCPPEVSLQIISKLSYGEKKNSSAVCHLWYHLSKSSDVFIDLTVKGNQKFKTFFEQCKPNAKKVRILRLIEPGIEPDQVLDIPGHFPNLEELEWVYLGSLDTITVYNENFGPKWIRITRFRELNSFCLSVEVLENGGFCNLTKLDVSFTSENFDCSLLILQLSKAPHLKKLLLGSTTMSLLNLKQLNFNASKLDTLYLSMITLREVDEDEQEVQVPITARGLTDFRMQILKIEESFELLSSCMAYMAESYKNLNHLTINSDHVPETPDEYESKLTGIVDNCPLLQSYNVSIFPITRVILQAMETRGIKLKELNIYKGSIQEQINCCLDFSQKHFLETMTINVDFKDNINTAFNHYLEGLSRFKHLETLKLENWKIQFDPETALDNSQTNLGNLKELVLENVQIMDTNGDAMSLLLKACPGLNAVSIQGKIIIDDELWKVDFSNHHLPRIEFNIAGKMYYKVDNQRSVRWHRVEDKTVQESYPATTLSNSQDTSHIFIVHESCTKLMIGKAYLPTIW